MRVMALVDDLMDRSRVSGALADVAFTRKPEACADADVVIVDLGRHAAAVAPVRVAAPSAWIVAFGPHVDDDALTAASRDGADVVLARSIFFRDPGAAVTAR
jgi:hypothetical protein